MTAVQTCPSLEEIAAFLDGRLRGEERERVVGHLASCPDCFELWHGAADLQEEMAAEEAREVAGEGEAPRPGEPRVGEPIAAPPGRSLPAPIPFRHPQDPTTRARRRRIATRAAYAAAAVVALAAVGPVFRYFAFEPAFSATLLRPLTHSDARVAQALAGGLYKERVMRGGSEGEPSPPRTEQPSWWA